MNINRKKCKVYHIGNQDFNYDMNIKRLKYATKCLDVIVDNNLKVSEQSLAAKKES